MRNEIQRTDSPVELGVSRGRCLSHHSVNRAQGGDEIFLGSETSGFSGFYHVKDFGIIDS